MENVLNISFSSSVEYELKRYLGDIKGINTDEYVRLLIKIQTPWYNLVKDKYSAEQIAESLYIYSCNIRRVRINESILKFYKI